MNVRVFIGSSSESLPLVGLIHRELDKLGMTIVPWNQGVFRPGDYALERLIEIVNDYDFGIFVIGPDDIGLIRGKNVLIARDNVIFEAGIFFSQLGRMRTLLVRPDKPSDDSDPPFHLPSDLKGLTDIGYTPPDTPADLRAKIGAACVAINEAIKEQGPRRVREAVQRMDSLSGGSIFLLRHAVEKRYTFSEVARILRFFHDAEEDAGIAWSKAAQFDIQRLSLLGLIKLGNTDVYATPVGTEFLAIQDVKDRFSIEFAKQLWKEEIPDKSGAPEPCVHFTCPSFTIQIGVDRLPILKNGTIPPEAKLSGEGRWEEIFDLAVPAEDYEWQDVVTRLKSPEPWIYPLAILMWQAYERERIQYPSVGVRFKFANQSDNDYRVFRLCLLKVTETAVKDKDGGLKFQAAFNFSVAAVVVPYAPANNPKETALYHLFNLAWFFRRRLLERELIKLDVELRKKPLREEELRNIIDAIDNDFRTLLADAQVRGMEEEISVIEAFDSPLREKVMTTLFEEWPQLYSELRKHLDVGISAAGLIKETLYKMKPVNSFFLKVSIEELNKFLGVQTMIYFLVRHKIDDFLQWKPYYDADGPARQEAGATELYLLRNIDDPNEIFLLFQADDLGKAREFIASADLRSKMQQSGVVDEPDIYFLERKLGS